MISLWAIQETSVYSAVWEAHHRDEVGVPHSVEQILDLDLGLLDGIGARKRGRQPQHDRPPVGSEIPLLLR